MTYTNPLHQTPNITSYSSLDAAVSGDQPTPSLPIPSRSRLPQPTFAPTAKWDVAMGRARSHPPIAYAYKGSDIPGVSMLDLSCRDFDSLVLMVEHSNEQIFLATGLQRINIRILVCILRS
jgi:hypothetical protein